MMSYVVAKRALQALIECAVGELAPKGLRATLIRPDYTSTPMLLNQERLVVEMAKQRQKNHRFLEPSEVAQLIVDALNSEPTEPLSVHNISG
jgi:NAD(P)-dependent dehydrogenase (short-subunit alcohol dehydrogenase family)